MGTAAAPDPGVGQARSHVANILVICQANQARSPLVQRLLTAEATARFGPKHGYQIGSAGLDALAGAPALDAVRKSAVRYGVDMAGHRARGLRVEMIGAGDMVITMTEAQRSVVSRLHPRSITRTFTLKEVVRLGSSMQRLPALPELTMALHRSRAVVAGSDTTEDVADPERLSGRETDRAVAEIVELTTVVGSLIFTRDSRYAPWLVARP